MMKKAMASDFDNTLYFMFLDEPYRKGDRESIRDFQQAGGLFGVSTGRALRGVRQAAGDDVHFISISWHRGRWFSMAICRYL